MAIFSEERDKGSMDYKALITLLKEENQVDQDVFLLSNHNGELLNHIHKNLLDANVFSVHLVKRVNQELRKIPGERVRYDWITMSSHLFLDRMNSMNAYFERESRGRKAGQLKSIAQTILHLDPDEITITKEPILLADDEEALHPTLLKRSVVRRILSGFLVFRELPRDQIIKYLERAFAHSRV